MFCKTEEVMERKEQPAGPVGQFMRRNGPFSTSLKLILPFFLISVSEVLNWTGHPVVRAEGRSTVQCLHVTHHSTRHLQTDMRLLPESFSEHYRVDEKYFKN